MLSTKYFDKTFRRFGIFRVHNGRILRAVLHFLTNAPFPIDAKPNFSRHKIFQISALGNLTQICCSCKKNIFSIYLESKHLTFQIANPTLFCDTDVCCVVCASSLVFFFKGLFTVARKKTRSTRSRQEDKNKKKKKKVKFEITFGNKKEANLPSQGILPQ